MGAVEVYLYCSALAEAYGGLGAVAAKAGISRESLLPFALAKRQSHTR